jgi:hypothetical protein
VFGYSNLATVDVHWSVFHINGVPLWAVAVIPLALFLIAGTLYHWVDGLHHFTEHMRHRRRVHELEVEVASLRAHLDQVLEMPDHSTSRLPARKVSTASLPAADERSDEPEPIEPEPEPAPAQAALPPPEPGPTVSSAVDGNSHVDAPRHRRSRSSQRKRVTLEAAGEPRKPDQSGSQVDGTTGAGNAAEPRSHEQEP